MKHLTDDELVLHYYDEDGPELVSAERHLETCLDCCDRLQFSRKLDAFVRERTADEPLPEGIETRLRERLRARRAEQGGS